ncbi:helix-turn-helix transcriptional regulator [soil metagenome]
MTEDHTDDMLRIGQAAALLGVSVDTIRRWEDDGTVEVVRSTGGQRLVALTEIRRLLGERPRTQRRVAASSARNQLDAVVINVVKGTAAASIEMQAGPHRLVALTTAESVDDLDLAPGRRVVASVKATNVVVGLPDD